jgi:signal transduction histidine kinase
MLVWVERKLGEQARLEQQIQAAERERTSILEEERVRIARDLHDGMAQTVYFLALKTDILRQRIAADAEAVQELREMGKALRQIIRDVRRTIFALRPLDWSQAGFLPALVGFVDDFAEQMDWEAVAVIDAAVQVPIRLEPTVFRLVQESLNNVAKHARATVVRVTLANEDDGYLRIIVEDNGRGFDQTGKNGGLGLNQMADRVSAVTSQIPLAGVSDG